MDKIDYKRCMWLLSTVAVIGGIAMLYGFVFVLVQVLRGNF